jgi:ribosomal protein S12 methylthiotransferase
MKIQKEISEENLKSKIGKIYKAIIDSKSFDGKYWIGRTYMDVPEEDGIVFIINETEESLQGKFVNIEITGVQEYDLIAKIIK